MGAQRARHAASLIRAAIAPALLAALALAGCGDGDSGSDDSAGLRPAGGGGVVTYALPRLPDPPDQLDPLTAPAPTLPVARQIHEPLFARVHAPYGAAFQAGLALSVKPSEGRTVWTVSLRSGVRFQDGTPFNASAVLANARRWASVAQGRRLLPGLFAVDAPRPGQVRFLFERPLAALGARLAAARLGVVSPLALAPQTGEGGRFSGERGSGTGPFEAGQPGGAEIELTRNPEWWGSTLGLGPALDGVAFRHEPSDAVRARLLTAGAAQIAGGLGPAQIAGLATEALVRTLPRRGLAFDASVRGLDSAGDPPSLSGVWLTRIRD